MKTQMETPTTRIAQAYCQMAVKAKYRPAAPGDGFGGIFLDSDQLADGERLHHEALAYARRFMEEEASSEFCIGVSCFDTVRAFVYAIEAARCLCAGSGFEGVAYSLLGMAASEINNTKAKNTGMVIKKKLERNK